VGFNLYVICHEAAAPLPGQSCCDFACRSVVGVVCIKQSKDQRSSTRARRASSQVIQNAVLVTRSWQLAAATRRSYQAEYRVVLIELGDLRRRSTWLSAVQRPAGDEAPHASTTSP